MFGKVGWASEYGLKIEISVKKTLKNIFINISKCISKQIEPKMHQKP